MRSYADEYGIMVAFQLINGYILTDPGIKFDFDAQVFNDLDFCIEDFFGEAVFGNSDGEPSTRDGQSFEYSDVIAFDSQIVSSRQTRGTCTDNSDLLALAFLLFGQIARIRVEIKIGNELFKMHDVDGIINLAPHTGRLAGMVTHAAANDGERIVLFDKFESFFILAGSD